MLKSEIKPGFEYAFREQRLPGTPFQHVKVVQHARGKKWRVQWIDPSPGLVDYADSGQLVVPWKERKAYLKEEENAEALRKYNERLGYVDDSPIGKALYEVFESVGDGISFCRGALRCNPAALDRVKTRAKADLTK